MVNESQRKRKESETVVIMIEDIVRTQQQDLLTIINMVRTILSSTNIRRERRWAITYSMSSKLSAQVKHMDRLFKLTDRDCISSLRMDRNAFGRLCRILRDRCGLVDQKYVRVEEQVAMFLSTLAHHNKTRMVGFAFIRSGHTVSHYVHEVMRAIIHLHNVLFVEPKPVDDACNDPRWKWFKVSLHVKINCTAWYYLLILLFTVEVPRGTRRDIHKRAY